MFKLPELPYSKTALTPFLEEEQLALHYEKHHKAYIDKLNKFLESEKDFEAKNLEEIILTTIAGPIFNNAAQAWNHTFFWHSMTPKNEIADISPPLAEAIVRDFGNRDALKTKFVAAGMEIFGSGWIWLCTDYDGKLFLVPTANAEVPFNEHHILPVIVADVWEHAYYIDYKNNREKYLQNFWEHINWKFASENYTAKKVRNFNALMT